MTAALRLAHGALLVVDVVEGVTSNTERLIRHALAERLQLVRGCRGAPGRDGSRE